MGKAWWMRMIVMTRKRMPNDSEEEKPALAGNPLPLAILVAEFENRGTDIYSKHCAFWLRLPSTYFSTTALYNPEFFISLHRSFVPYVWQDLAHPCNDISTTIGTILDASSKLDTDLAVSITCTQRRTNVLYPGEAGITGS
jgi:hypothetical protein